MCWQTKPLCGAWVSEEKNSLRLAKICCNKCFLVSCPVLSMHLESCWSPFENLRPLFLEIGSLLHAVSSACPHKHKGACRTSEETWVVFFSISQFKPECISDNKHQRQTQTEGTALKIFHGFTMSRCLCISAPVLFWGFFLKLIWSSNTASQDSQINIYHLLQLWDHLLQCSLILLPVRSCFWHRDGERKKRWGEEREWEILAEVPERLQIPLPQLWDLSNSRPQHTHCQMAQLAGWHTGPHRGVTRVSASPRQGPCHRSLQSLEHEHPLLAHLHRFVLPN